MSLIYKNFRETALKHGGKAAVYWKEEGKWRFFSFREFLEKVDGLASGFRRLGLKTGDRAAILSENRPEWLLSDLALNKVKAVSVPIHFTSKKPLIEYILNDSESGFFIVSANLLDKFRDFFLSRADLKIIVIGGQASSPFFNFQDLIEKEKDEEIFYSEEDGGKVASVIYTSGTTGEPKGVMLTNKNFLFNVRASCQAIPLYPSDKFLSFLPLSHVLERTGGSFAPLLSGAAIAYAQNLKTLSADLLAVKPTVLVSVPKIFERIYEEIFANVRKKSFFARSLFFWSLKQKENSPGYWLADKLVLRKIRKIFGGSLRFAISGGASINEKILRFFQRVGIKVAEGYGLTETAPIVAVNSLEDSRPGKVGRPLAGVEVKIAPDKEILVRGENVMAGYWKKEELTAETLDRDGWFKTGDLGFLDSEGFLTIIGRKKDLIVTSNGKNIAPEKIENILNLSPLIEQSLVVGHGRNYLSALIVPGKTAASEENIVREIEKVNQTLEAHEQVRKFKLLSRPFSLEEDELTPTLKIRRKIVEQKYKEMIDEMYE